MKLNSLVDNVLAQEKERLKNCFRNMQSVFKAIEGDYEPTDTSYIKTLEVLSAIQRAYGYIGELTTLARNEPAPPMLDKFWSFDENGEINAISSSEYEKLQPAEAPFLLN